MHLNSSKMAHPTRTTVEKWIEGIPELEFDGIDLRCNVCASVLSWATKTRVTEHLSTKKHRAHIRGDRSARENQTIFNVDLVKMFISCNLPWNTLDNVAFREFLENCLSGKYNNVVVPAESTLRRGYLSTACEEIQTQTVSELRDKNIWVSVDETSDATGRNIAHVLVGGMQETVPMPARLISCAVLDEANSKTIAKCVDDSLRKLWGSNLSTRKGQVLLYVTDAAGYMKASAERLKNLYKYENMLHVTCFLHGLHRIAECVRGCYPNIDKLISSVKKMFMKVPSTQKQFCDELPDTPLPPESLVTRWNVWLEEASYYYIYFNDVKGLIDRLDSNEAAAIFHAQQAFKDATIKEDLMYVHSHFSRISLSIKRLQSSTMSPGYSIVHQMNAIFDLRHFLYRVPGGAAERVKNEFKSVLRDNPGFFTLCGIVDLLEGKEVDFSEAQLNVPSLKNFNYFKYAPVTSVDVERSFSTYNWIFNERRHNLTPEHLEQLVVIYFNSQRY